MDGTKFINSPPTWFLGRIASIDKITSLTRNGQVNKRGLGETTLSGSPTFCLEPTSTCNHIGAVLINGFSI